MRAMQTSRVITGNKNVSSISLTDIVVTGGIIHIVDQLLSIPVSVVSEITAANLEYFVSILNLGGYLSAANTYVNEVLQVTDVTFFIPNSEAALTAATNLSRSSNSTELQSIFEYHVISGFAGYSPLLKDGMQLTTAQGSNVTITIQDGDTYVNAAKVTTFDYLIANGVAHVIDDLLNPSDPSLPAKPTTTATASPTTTSSSTSAASSTTLPVSHSNHQSHSRGRTIGLAVGVTIGGLLLLGALIWFLLWSRNRKREAARAEQENLNRTSVINTGLGNFYYVGSDQPQPMGMNNRGSIFSKSASPPTVPQRSPSRLN
ncbi:putative beta-ig-h3 fasciclin [Phaeomoniella chlamydospora]|uniref:Putative beta-ig-h3 fasciclin n=1 Tax=Phaeomoniella chlamydospora TaxID=158046 RepID=A0A0G2FZ36_PHACM|nr:putative beta-ig-h3 fasciclin [Phaeomoniella chlamydospora]